MWTSVLQVTNVIAVPRVTIQMDHTPVSVTAATQETDAPVGVLKFLLIIYLYGILTFLSCFQLVKAISYSLNFFHSNSDD